MVALRGGEDCKQRGEEVLVGCGVGWWVEDVEWRLQRRWKGGGWEWGSQALQGKPWEFGGVVSIYRGRAARFVGVGRGVNGNGVKSIVSRGSWQVK